MFPKSHTLRQWTGKWEGGEVGLLPNRHSRSSLSRLTREGHFHFLNFAPSASPTRTKVKQHGVKSSPLRLALILINTMRAFRPITDKQPQRRGTTAVEVAVTLPVFCVIMVGLMECSHAMLIVHSLDSAARQAGRYGAVDGISSAQVTTKAKAIMAKSTRVVPTVLVKDGGVFDSTNFNPTTIDYSSLANKELSTADDDQMFIVRLSVPYNDVSLLPPFWIKNITLTGQAVMRHE